MVLMCNEVADRNCAIVLILLEGSMPARSRNFSIASSGKKMQNAQRVMSMKNCQQPAKPYNGL
jgi:hypothetical protein